MGLKGRRIMGYGIRQEKLKKAAKIYERLKRIDEAVEERNKSFEPKTILRKKSDTA